MSKLNVAVICGGISSEHEISCVSAGGVLKGLDSTKYNAVLIGITKAGKWVLLPNDYPLEIVGGTLPTVSEGAPAVVADIHGFSVAGKALEIANLPYVGSGVLASAVAMDKSFAKPIFAAAGMKVADGIVVTSKDKQ
ncbi:MAG: hypothetical protein RL290_491, partial [Actinomycetota bacterium]